MSASASSKSTRPLVALSPNGKTLACIPGESATVLRILLYQVESSSLQTTLTHRNRPGDDEANELSAPLKIFFAESNRLVILCSDQILTWDLTRGVVAFSVPAKKGTSFHDATTHDAQLLVLASTNDSGKVQIQQYSSTTGKLERKVKAGKGGACGLGVAVPNYLVVRHEDSVRVLSLKDGSKLAKCGSLTESNAGEQNLAVCQDLAATVTQGQIVLVNVTSGKKLSSIPLDKTTTTSTHASFELWQQNQTSAILCQGEKLHQISLENGKVEKTWSSPFDGSVERQVHLGCKNSVVAFLTKNGQYQLSTLPLDDDKEELRLTWKSPETEQENKKDGSKRKEAPRDTVLGPAHTGGEAIVSESRPAKKTKTETEDENDKEGSERKGDGEEEDENDGVPTLGERLQLLKAALDQEDKEEEIDEDDKEYDAEYDFHPRKVTTESLGKMLQQGLQSGEERLLELALSVRDVKILQETCRELDDNLLPGLLNALTTRLLAKPNRAELLCLWISVLLRTGRVRSTAHLQPLRNIIEERVEVFPELLKLQGRLNFMTRFK